MPLGMDETDDMRPWEGGWSVIARVGDRRLVFPAAEVSSVLPVPPLWRPPTSPKPVVGFLPVASEAMPVLHAALLLGLPEPERPDFYAHILVLPALGGAGGGLLVDRAEETVMIAAEAIAPLDPADTLNGCAIALADTGHGLVPVLSVARLLATAETAALAELTDLASRRLAAWEVPA
ncbi:chemotaxis protein CheW [Sphingomonas sp.]|uniref:chemotaxis protein CheW n=1 Tax=Sphingomonas sp. TaxID=28214 RepID=UPI0025FA601D|nr:chemotaxis protein CheW [Sphingomonas sp.]